MGRHHLTDKICGIPSKWQLTDNKGNFSKQSVFRQQLSASRLTLTLIILVDLANPDHLRMSLIGKRQEARGEICDSCSCCVGQVVFLDNLLLSVK